MNHKNFDRSLGINSRNADLANVISVDKSSNKQGLEVASSKNCCRFRPFLAAILLGIAALVGFGFYAHRSTQTIPEFYQVALDVAPEVHREAGQEFESQLLQLNTDVRNQSEWTTTFSQAQVNGWLAIELPENLPGTIPPEISEPRVAFSDNKLQLAFQFVSPRFSGIVTATGTVFCTDVPNQIGVQIISLNSGVVPLPINVWADSIKKGCAKAGINLMWSQKNGDTVAIIDLPEKFLDIRKRKITLESVVVGNGEVTLSGTSVPLGDSSRLRPNDNVVYLPSFVSPPASEVSHVGDKNTQIKSNEFPVP